MKKRQGISLIVLVITIIVMIILAGAIILSLNNSGIIDKASETVDKSNEAQIKNMVQLGWAETYTKYGADIDKLKEGVTAIIEKNKIDVSEYGIKVTTRGVEVVKGWMQDGLTVVKGNFASKEKQQKALIGDRIAYVATGTDYNDGWQILGASDEGELLILSNSHILYWDEELDYDLEAARQLWLTAAQELDDNAKSYGQGKNAIGARCIKIEDIEKVIGLDKTTCQQGLLSEYGNEITYTYDATTKKVSYTSTNGINGTSNAVYSEGFYYYDGTSFEVANTSDVTVTLKNNTRFYNIPYGNIVGEEIKNSKAYPMLFGENDLHYVLASNYFSGGDYGIFSVFHQYVGRLTIAGVGNNILWYDNGNVDFYICPGSRAVVSLSGDTNLTGSSEAGWSY